MQTIFSLGTRQLRSFGENQTPIPIKPINIFVGKNSCGKSTFLRTFPLLRQSIQANTKSPILWFGDLVDFGDFNTALHDGGEEISFDFNTRIEMDEKEEGWALATLLSSSGFHKKSYAYDVCVSISISKVAEKQLKTRVSFVVENTKIELVYNNNAVELVAATNIKYGMQFTFSGKLVTEHGSLLPLAVRGLREVKGENDVKHYTITNPIPSEASSYLSKYLASFHHGTKKATRLRAECDELSILPSEELRRKIAQTFSKDRHFQKSLEAEHERITEISFTLLMAKGLDRLLASADKLFSEFFSGVRYQGPLRAAGERFYRYQDLRVDEVDHTGGNLPMVINSLESIEQAQLSKWILEYFGFELKLMSNGLHYELLIREEEDKKFHNISDMGFGYSQILPVIVSIWLESVSTGRSRRFRVSQQSVPRIIVLEQPELHLHPALQYKFGRSLARVMSITKRPDLYFVIETHSKHLIDALGEAVREKEVSGSSVNITLFQKLDDGITETKISGFDEDGYLVNWPVGFLSPEYDY
ncbi:AAA family ATPase [Pseudomonas sp. B21-059]|uniref:AAA family ATPase n=1 Tax=Pseudomonas sp. B21-059 TaxID=2895496 RepID=UPI002234423E|nr:AAA family ATPase [Pseudomonas sp. B21-059]UZE34727.1 AAA family ATPase [Pseudomonas sp. B21-059]